MGIYNESLHPRGHGGKWASKGGGGGSKGGFWSRRRQAKADKAKYTKADLKHFKAMGRVAKQQEPKIAAVKKLMGGDGPGMDDDFGHAAPKKKAR